MVPQGFIRLSELTALIYGTIQGAFEGKTFWVVADVTNHTYKDRDERHFFVLAEKKEGTNAVAAKMETVAWKAGAAKIRGFEAVTGQKFQSGIHVLLKVSVSYSPEYGMKLTMHDIDINFTIGALEQQKQDILKKLEDECAAYVRKEGDRYITRNNELGMNAVIQKIALVCSDATAGYEDFMHTLENNPYQYSFFIDNYFTPVQGENNSVLVRQMLVDIYNSRKNYDAVVIIRGGGSQTDFLIFETFILGQAIAKFPIPVITGIGHQRNETIVDLMAHSPTKTPTKAAEYIIAHNKEFEQELLYAQETILNASQQQLQLKLHALDPVITNIKNYTKMYLHHHDVSLKHLDALITMLDPVNLLKKGFAIVYYKGKIAAGLADITPGEQINVVMKDMEINATVNSKIIPDGDFKL